MEIIIKREKDNVEIYRGLSLADAKAVLQQIVPDPPSAAETLRIELPTDQGIVRNVDHPFRAAAFLLPNGTVRDAHHQAAWGREGSETIYVRMLRPITLRELLGGRSGRPEPSTPVPTNDGPPF